ncbi:MAG: site-2 protease family protein [Ruminiclostridium sp.]|nr:site-2 protease family protein [Ruminiclostridium sp.]
MGRLHSTGGFWLLMGALLLAAPLPLVGWFVLACAVHELGHLLAIHALGGRVGEFWLTGLGAVMTPRRRMFSYGEECLVALAGPGASLLLALLAAPVWETLAGLSLALGLFNLLPLAPLDGGRILGAVVSRLAGPDTGERVGRLVTRALALSLAAVGLWTAAQGGSFTLLLFSLGFLFLGER